MNNEPFEYNNEEEAEMAQLQSIHSNLNAIGKVQDKLAEQRKFESLLECVECGEPIPEARRTAIRGCTTCVDCQQILERKGLA